MLRHKKLCHNIKSFVMTKFPSCCSSLCHDINLCVEREFLSLQLCFMSQHKFRMSQHALTLLL